MFSVLAYVTLYSSGLLYSFYKFYSSSNNLKDYLYLNDGWFGRAIDQNDQEWNVLLPSVIVPFAASFMHLIIAQTIRCYKPKALDFTYIAFGTILTIKLVGFVGLFLSIISSLIIFFTSLTGKKYFVWMATLAITLLQSSSYTTKLKVFNHDSLYLFHVFHAWMLLKSTSFTVEFMSRISEEKNSKNGENQAHKSASIKLGTFIELFSYLFHISCLFTGPFIPYNYFLIGRWKKFEKWTFQKFAWFIAVIVKLMIWAVLAHTSLHFFYGHALNYYRGFTDTLNSAWSVSGHFLFNLLFFNVKYTVFYGLPILITQAEGFPTPAPPGCFGITARFSDVWKHFDVGLHKFMVRYIYVPIVGEKREIWKQIIASTLVFGYMFLWHGANDATFWSLNVILMFLEKFGEQFFNSVIFKSFQQKYLNATIYYILCIYTKGLFIFICLLNLENFVASFDVAWETFMYARKSGFLCLTIIAVMLFMASEIRVFFNEREKRMKKE